MEAIRSIQAEPQVEALDVIDELPPPPAPFPLDQLAISSELNGNGMISRSEQPRQHVRNYLASVQQSCISALSSLLPPESASSHMTSSSESLSSYNAQLASALTDLLEVTYELDELLPPSTNITPSTIHTETFPDADSPADRIQSSFNALTNLLEGLQDARLTDDLTGYQDTDKNEREESNQGGLHPAINVVREELAWQRLESLSTAIVRLSQDRSSSSHETLESNVYSKEGNELSQSTANNGLPPAYQQFIDNHPPSVKENDKSSVLPSYQDIRDEEEASPSLPIEDKSQNADSPISPVTSPGQQSSTREKMLLELDSLTSAIERLSSVVPRLHDQRVEMRHTASSSSSKSRIPITDGHNLSKEDKIKLEKQKMKELEEIWDKIERAHGKRRIMVEDGQRADGEIWERRTKERFINRIVDQAEARRLDDQDSIMGAVDADLARARDLRNRDHFLRDLIDSSEERRLDNQDANIPKTADRKASLIENLMEYSTSGRLHDQDSLPPTPRHGNNGEKIEDPLELVTVQDFLAGGGPDRSRSLGRDTFRENTNGNAEGSSSMARSRSNSVPLDEGIMSKKSISGRSTPTTFKKIAGMMRRGSGQLNLPLKPNNGFDANNIAYVTEHQENLRSVQITLHGIGVSSNLELQVESSMTNDEEAVITSKMNPSISIRIALPTAIQHGQIIPFSAQSLHLEAKLVAQPIPPSVASLLPSYPLSAPDLRKIEPTTLCCTSCERELATLPTDSYKDLPSEHWAEMMEVWMCHNDPSFTARLAEKTKEGFWPQNGGVLVGGSYLLIGKERIKWGNITAEQGDQVEPWNVISCHCGEVLGKQRSKDDKPGAETVRFSKWAVALLKEDDDEEIAELIRFPLSVFVVSDMLELSQAHASHRFIVSEEESGNKRIYVWLFNPSVKMSYAKPTEPSPMPSPLRKSITLDGEEKSRISRRSSIASSIGGKSVQQKVTLSASPGQIVLRAAKIMYKIVEMNGEKDLDDLPGFGLGGQVESLSYPTTICDKLINTLKESSRVYPVGRRSLDAFDIGFLGRV
ncbi:uncharacterized protein I206_102731 [Kwoniella pini CBS 10737]|uniref:HECT domain-containing protein n=1 Tax=Kwoniella pini CBS 10737 TaxID=1296096 RepID=A0A1B9I6B4_9TREE|nr:uncharacterized protein I206_03086 [Kwoniella pini CBS 10737]OCF51021.1 hypothetical protein I206_03086 [Kwoniella pini CBS 10737]